ncbi:hypothetical protein DFH06DRAFT_1137196 [Mycena polygramma]|nr:hypothetical protein DFH06DRAFT_1137196 [Mycena polygramma]
MRANALATSKIQDLTVSITELGFPAVSRRLSAEREPRVGFQAATHTLGTPGDDFEKKRDNRGCSHPPRTIPHANGEGARRIVADLDLAPSPKAGSSKLSTFFANLVLRKNISYTHFHPPSTPMEQHNDPRPVDDDYADMPELVDCDEEEDVPALAPAEESFPRQTAVATGQEMVRYKSPTPGNENDARTAAPFHLPRFWSIDANFRLRRGEPYFNANLPVFHSATHEVVCRACPPWSLRADRQRGEYLVDGEGVERLWEAFPVHNSPPKAPFMT